MPLTAARQRVDATAAAAELYDSVLTRVYLILFFTLHQRLLGSFLPVSFQQFKQDCAATTCF